MLLEECAHHLADAAVADDDGVLAAGARPRDQFRRNGPRPLAAARRNAAPANDNSGVSAMVIEVTTSA